MAHQEKQSAPCGLERLKGRVMQQGAHLAVARLIHLGHQLGMLRIGSGLDIRRHNIAQHGLKIIQCASRARAAGAGFSRAQGLLE